MGRILIRFNEDQVSEPIASQIIIEYKVPMAILSAHINSKGGEILAEVPDDILESCGSCLALCPVEAISLTEDSTVQFDKEKCVGSTCSVCVDACPARAIKSVKPNNNGTSANREKKR
jgi:NAD-dependent dihydropyrimidine dehydrogenase PreA subunit